MTMLKNMFLLVLMICMQYQDSLGNDLKGFDDTVLFNLNWPEEALPEDLGLGKESIIVTSLHQEKYKCILPSISEQESNLDDNYDGPTALELISNLFTQSACSFRLESYWTYEVCHGRYIRQYHEDREGKTVKIQEYVLGKWDENHYEKFLSSAKEEEVDEGDEVQTKKIDNVNLPYLEITMENGTLCDLNNNKPRLTKVLYVCYAHGKHEIYSLKEISTCLYEIIILTPLLCSHPKFRPKETGEHKISCYPLNGASRMPYSLAKMLHDSYTLRKSSEMDRFKVELIKIDKEDVVSVTEKKFVDMTPVENFLLGRDCLNGGTGWWKYEFCYGKTVEQYHSEKDGRRTSINLGKFNKKAHLEWMKENPHKRPKPLDERKQLSHFYSGGSICDKTGKPRQTEVKLKCLKNPPSPNAVSLYLLEPKYCHYILGVESPLICDILPRADENGLINVHENESIDSDSTTMMVNIKL